MAKIKTRNEIRFLLNGEDVALRVAYALDAAGSPDGAVPTPQA